MTQPRIANSYNYDTLNRLTTLTNSLTGPGATRTVSSVRQAELFQSCSDFEVARTIEVRE